MLIEREFIIGSIFDFARMNFRGVSIFNEFCEYWLMALLTSREIIRSMVGRRELESHNRNRFENCSVVPWW